MNRKIASIWKIDFLENIVHPFARPFSEDGNDTEQPIGMCPGVLVRIAGACAGTLNALIYTIIAQFRECKVALLVLSQYGLSLDVLLALLPLGVTRESQPVEHGLHRDVLNRRAILEQAINMLPGIGDIAQLHGQTDAALTIVTPDTKQTTQQHLVISVISQFPQPNVIISVYCDQVRILQDGWVIQPPGQPFVKGRLLSRVTFMRDIFVGLPIQVIDLPVAARIGFQFAQGFDNDAISL
jgi:hypothetical protein